MPHSPRSLCSAVVLALLLLWPWSAEAQSLDVRIEGDHLRISVMKVRLLAGDALQKLRDGATVTFVARLSTLSSRAGTVLGHVDYRFVVSYDIFEEKFQVTRILPSSRVVSHVSQATAEAAFSDGLELPIPGPNPNMPFWIRWEYQTETESPSGDVGLSLGGLVEIFSRKNANEPARAVVESGPHRLSDLPRISAPRGTR